MIWNTLCEMVNGSVDLSGRTDISGRASDFSVIVVREQEGACHVSFCSGKSIILEFRLSSDNEFLGGRVLGISVTEDAVSQAMRLYSAEMQVLEWALYRQA